MKDGTACFKSRRDRDAGLRFSVWCIDSSVLPGDSGGALLVEAPDGTLHYAGVISAGSGGGCLAAECCGIPRAQSRLHPEEGTRAGLRTGQSGSMTGASLSFISTTRA